MSSSTPSSRLHPLTFWCQECDMSISLLPSPSPLPCPHCLRSDSLLPLDSISPFLPPQHSPAPNLSISSLPTIQIFDVISVCAICKDDLPRGSFALRLPCSHHYHSHCILPWLSLRNSCPLCRFRIRFLKPGAEEDELDDVVMSDIWDDLFA